MFNINDSYLIARRPTPREKVMTQDVSEKGTRIHTYISARVYRSRLKLWSLLNGSTSSGVSGWNRNKSFAIYRNERGHRVENETTEGAITQWAHCFYKCATPFVTQRNEKENRQLSRLIVPPVKRLVRRSMNENPFTTTRTRRTVLNRRTTSGGERFF